MIEVCSPIEIRSFLIEDCAAFNDSISSEAHSLGKTWAHLPSSSLKAPEQAILSTKPFSPDQPRPRVTLTPADYANLLFCETFEEEEVRANAAEAQYYMSTSNPAHGKNGKRRRVTFSASSSVDLSPAYDMTPEKKSQMWYSRTNLEEFKKSAQHSIKEIRDAVTGKAECRNRFMFRSKMVAMEKETNSSIRGLEHRVFRRKQTRHMLIKDVLQCQNHINGLASFGHGLDFNQRTELIANVSQERSEKAKSIARFDAREDYVEVNNYDKRSPPVKKRKRQKQFVNNYILSEAFDIE